VVWKNRTVHNTTASLNVVTIDKTISTSLVTGKRTLSIVSKKTTLRIF
jgi:hypothetical protein